MSLYSRYPNNNNNRVTRRTLTKTNNSNEILLPLFFVIQTNIPPIISIVDYSTTKLSRVSGKNEISITFSSDKDLSEWEVRADGTGVGSGDLIASGGAVSSNVNFTVNGIQLTWGDKIYRINVYGKSTEGVWNSYE